MADRCGPWTPGVTVAGGLDRFLGSGTRKVAETDEEHSAGLDVPSRGAPRDRCPGESSCVWSTTPRPKSGARCPLLRDLPASLSGRRPTSGASSQAMPGAWLWLMAWSCGPRRPGRQGGGARPPVSAAALMGEVYSLHLRLQRAGPESGLSLSLEVLGCCTESHLLHSAWGSLLHTGLV